MASKRRIIRLPARIHSMTGHSMVRSMELVVVASRGVEAVAGHSVVDEGSVVGGKVKVVVWDSDGTGGDLEIQSPLAFAINRRGGAIMPFGRGFGFRGGSPPWPYVGWGRGGLPRCWAFAPANWDTPYADPALLGAYPYPFPEYWGPYGMSDPFYSQAVSGYPQPGGLWGSPYGSPIMTAEGEREWLKNQAESISQEIDRIKSRISELEKE